MDTDLERSVRLLEDALSTTGRGLLKANVHTSRRNRLSNISLSIPSLEQKKLGDSFSIYEDVTDTILRGDKSMTGSIIQAKTPWKNATESLYIEFLEIIQSYSGGHDALEIVADLARCCSDGLKVVQGLQAQVAVSTTEEEKWLENERNTWRLLFVLYQDRFHSQNVDNLTLQQYFGISEKLCMKSLFKRDCLVRESQLVIDWLECNESEKDNDALHFSDSSCGWENTLHQLKIAKDIPFESEGEIVNELHPDAPYVCGKQLHSLDVQDDKQLCKKVFRLTRCGKLKDAQELCRQCGHGWRAALYEGWKLHHNLNLPSNIEVARAEGAEVDTSISHPVEGNRNRDIWKLMALQYSVLPYLDVNEKATIAALCGSLDGLLPVCQSWEDFVWAYLKVLVDIRVESEIRDCVNYSYRELPPKYWDQRMSLNEVFDHIGAVREESVRLTANQPHHVIQKFIILDQVPKLLAKLDEWIDDPQVSTQFLRFAAHLVLFLELIGQTPDRECVERVLEAYIKHLCEANETQLVAYYTSRLNSARQVQLYASYLERIIDKDERQEALQLAEDCSINVLACTKQVVENIRSRPHDTEESGSLREKITDADLFKISALDWITFYDTQRAEALLQANALIFTFLTLGKLDAAQLAFNKVPSDTVQKVVSDDDLVSEEVNQAVKEYLSYKAYLHAQETFSEWYKHYQNRPIPPEAVPENAQFTDKVAYEHKVALYSSEMERWKLSSSLLAKAAKTSLYNVLLFPEGWLVGAQDSDYLRSKCIPEVTLLLFKVLFESEQHEECVQLADLLATEKYQLYKVYSKEKLGEVLTKLCESSVALLNMKKDPWGNDRSS